ncbi:MAG: FIST N-terminal domain-containing protein [Campylobacterota bacterium]|nr:FIST N-terminal domain-containing protein [Campylobacterota bacterium]
MQIQELYYADGEWQCDKSDMLDPATVDLVLLFGDVTAFDESLHLDYMQSHFPTAHVVGASTAGTIENGHFSDHTMVATAIAFDKATVEVAAIEGLDNDNLEAKSKELIEQLPQEGLKHVFLLMDGIQLNGSLVARGVNSVNKTLCVTGGLAGDRYKFKRTVVMADGMAKERQIVAIGLYGDSLSISVGCEAGWDEFGAERVVTRSEGNVVYEIDNKPALKLYEDYLGEYLKDLPTSGLRFPLNIREYDGDKEVVRVMMHVNADKSLLFAGDVPQGSTVRLMKTNVNNLIKGSELVSGLITQHNAKRALALTVSCSGRQSVLKQLVDEELNVIQETLGEQVHIGGFYSYGELAPFSDNLSDCKLHNQSLTLTVIYED